MIRNAVLADLKWVVMGAVVGGVVIGGVAGLMLHLEVPGAAKAGILTGAFLGLVGRSFFRGPLDVNGTDEGDGNHR